VNSDVQETVEGLEPHYFLWTSPAVRHDPLAEHAFNETIGFLDRRGRNLSARDEKIEEVANPLGG